MKRTYNKLVQKAKEKRTYNKKEEIKPIIEKFEEVEKPKKSSKKD